MAANLFGKCFSSLFLLLAIISGTALAAPAVNLSEEDKALAQDGFVIVQQGGIDNSTLAVATARANLLPVPRPEAPLPSKVSKKVEKKIIEEDDHDPGFASAIDADKSPAGKSSAKEKETVKQMVAVIPIAQPTAAAAAPLSPRDEPSPLLPEQTETTQVPRMTLVIPESAK